MREKEVCVYLCTTKPCTSFIHAFALPSELLNPVFLCAYWNEHRPKGVLVIPKMLGLTIVVTQSYRRLCACDTCARLQGTRRKHCNLLSSGRPSLLPPLTSARSLRLAASVLPVATIRHSISARDDRVFVRASIVILRG